MKSIGLVLIFAGGLTFGVTLAQTATTPASKSPIAAPEASQAAPAGPAPTLSTTTKVALSGLADQRERLLNAEKQWSAAFQGVDEDVKREHPGWHLNPKTFAVEKDNTQTPKAKK